MEGEVMLRKPVAFLTIIVIFLYFIFRPAPLQNRLHIAEIDNLDQEVVEWIQNINANEKKFSVAQKVFSRTEGEYYIYPHNIYVTGMYAGLSLDKKGLDIQFTHYREGEEQSQVYILAYRGRRPSYININNEHLITSEIPLITN